MSSARMDLTHLQRRVQSMIARGTVTSVDDAFLQQILAVELEKGFRSTDIENWHPYGFTSVPGAGAEVATLAIGGNRDHLLALVSDRRYRIKGLAGGEVAIHDDQGQMVHFKRTGILVKSDLRIDLGDEGGAKVMTTSGPAANVYAKV